MDYRVTYIFEGKIISAHLEDCQNILDAVFKFYETRGIDTEIQSIEKW